MPSNENVQFPGHSVIVSAVIWNMESTIIRRSGPQEVDVKVVMTFPGVRKRPSTHLLNRVEVMNSISHEGGDILSLRPRTTPTGPPASHRCIAPTVSTCVLHIYLYRTARRRRGRGRHLGLVRRLKYSRNCFVLLNSLAWAAPRASLHSWAR